MDNARLLLAILLAIAVIVVTNLLFPPARRPSPATGADTATVDTGLAHRPESPARPPEPGVGPPAGNSAATPGQPAATETAKAAGTAPAGAPSAAGAATAEQPGSPPDTLVVSSPLYRYAISSAGGSFLSASLLRFRSFTHPGPVQLAPAGEGPLVRLRLQLRDTVIDLDRLAFSIQGPDRVDLRQGDAPRTVRLVHRDSAGGPALTLSYTFRSDGYLIDVAGDLSGWGSSPLTLVVGLGPRLAYNDADTAEDRRALSYVVDNQQQGIVSQRLDKVSAQEIQEGPLIWSAMRDKYFLAALISACQESGLCFGGAIARPTPALPGGVDLATTLPLGNQSSFRFSLYLGPQENDRLARIGHDLEDVNPYGWRIFRPVIRPLTHIVVWAINQMHRVLSLGYGWVLLLFGILIRGLLWPLNARAMRSQLKNMQLQPVIQELQTKYKNDPERLQKEMLRLYREEGFNPLGGCLPMLIPYPVLITLFFVFQNTIEFRGAGFLWLPDLSRPDPLYILPLLLGVSMFALQWLSARAAPSNRQMQVMMWIMPAFITLFFFKLASGLNLYYAASNLASIPQQLQIMRERGRAQKQAAR
jgi:YidC/Oxa1 family membrane protein insertase